MPKHTRYLSGLAFCLCAQWAGHAWAQAAAVPTQDTVRAALASGKPTPLDALTPHGKHELIREMRWRDGALVSFGHAPLIRELDHEQLAAILHFLRIDDYLSGFSRELVGPPLRLPAPSSQVAHDLQALDDFAQGRGTERAGAFASATEVGAPAVLRRYQELFGKRLLPATLPHQPLGDLLPLFDAAALAALGNPASPALDDLVAVQRELAARGIDTRRTIDDRVLRMMLAARRFEQARIFAATRPELAGTAIPHVEDPLGPDFSGRSVFTYDAARRTLIRQALPAASGMELVLVVGEGCRFSKAALQALQDDAALQVRLRQANLVLVTAPTAPVDTGLMARWNAANPRMPIRAPYSAAEWDVIDVSGIPAFFLLRHGKVIGRHAGWTPEAKAEVLTLLDGVAE